MKRFLSIILFSALLLSTCALAEEGKATFYWNYDFDASGVVNDTGDIVTTMAFEYGKNISKCPSRNAKNTASAAGTWKMARSIIVWRSIRKM